MLQNVKIFLEDYLSLEIKPKLESYFQNIKKGEQ